MNDKIRHQRRICEDNLWFHRLLVLIFSLAMGTAWAAPQEEIIVIYNRNLPESEQLARYYASRRQIPERRLFGFALPATETISRSQYQQDLERPLLSALDSAQLFHFEKTTNTSAGERVKEARIRYAAVCYGVPVRILRDSDLSEKGEEKVRPELRRNEAAVDSELAMLPFTRFGYPLFGPLPNAHYGTTNSKALNPTNGLLMVSRLDGPSVTIARGLVDQAMEAETNGLWGRAYFDARGLTNTSYKLGDDWIRGAALVCRQLGFETVLDDRPATFSAAYPMSQIAFYAGWYDTHVSGPFSLPEVEFMPGAIAYHLHSFSAHLLRRTNLHWAGPLLAKGATATLGCVDEPYLEATPDIAILFARLLRGFTFGEAAYASQRSLSWQTTVVGDPLYCPFGQPPQVVHESLWRRHNFLVEWSFLRVVNLNTAMGTSNRELIRYLDRIPLAQKSGVLQEKLGDLHLMQTNVQEAIRHYRKALDQKPSRQQSIRLTMQIVRLQETKGDQEAAYKLLKTFPGSFPDYPELAAVYRRLQEMAQSLGKTDEAEVYQRKIELLIPVTEATAQKKQ